MRNRTEQTADLIREAKNAMSVALQQEEWAVEAYARAYGESMSRTEEGSTILYATEDGWDQGPLPYALELQPGNNDGCDPDAVFLFRDGGPTCDHFWMEEAEAAVEGGKTPAQGALAFVRQITYPSGQIAFLDGHQAAGLLLAVLGEEGR